MFKIIINVYHDDLSETKPTTHPKWYILAFLSLTLRLNTVFIIVFNKLLLQLTSRSTIYKKLGKNHERPGTGSTGLFCVSGWVFLPLTALPHDLLHQVGISKMQIRHMCLIMASEFCVFPCKYVQEIMVVAFPHKFENSGARGTITGDPSLQYMPGPDPIH